MVNHQRMVIPHADMSPTPCPRLHFPNSISLTGAGATIVVYAAKVQRWKCPKCEREFGRKGQGHMCSPGLTLDEYFETAQPWERPIYDVVSRHLLSLGDVIIDPITVGIQFKNGPVFCSLRAKTKWTAVGFSLRRKLESAKLSRKVMEHAGKYFHVVNVSEADQIDEEVLGWLTEAWHLAGGTEPPRAAMADAQGDGMVPDDLDLDDF